jgi:hypothetical protein
VQAGGNNRGGNLAAPLRTFLALLGSKSAVFCFFLMGKADCADLRFMQVKNFRDQEMREILEKDQTEDRKDDFYVIPFRLGADIVLKAAVNPSLKTKSTVYGSVPGQIIMVEEPQFALNERFTFICQQFECVYLHNVYLFKFKSEFIKEIIPCVIGIGYPTEVERVQIRAYARMPVAIETEVFLGTKDGTVTAVMEDLSVGGCRLQLPRLVQVQKGAKFQLSFLMPDNTIIKNLVCVVMNIKFLHGKKSTVIGACFAEPSATVKKIEQFCRLFAVEQIE